MMKKTIAQSINLTILIVLLINIPLGSSKEPKPALKLATLYPDKLNNDNNKIQQYWVSEKLDGVRGRWTGSKLITRQGNIIITPQSFTKNWPEVALDGEAWISSNSFAQESGIVRRKTAKESDWQDIKFMIFDLPNHHGTFSQRIIKIKALVVNAKTPTLQLIKQSKVSNSIALTELLDTVDATKGEGLMLHHQDALYTIGRSKQLLKLKKHHDSEAKVISHIEGKGKYKGKMGALLVTTTDGITFKIGSGFSDQQRMTPPPIGCIITFKYFGKTQNGVPRFASFMRIRHPNQAVKSAVK